MEKARKMSKMDPEMGAQTRSFFGHLAPFFGLGSPNGPQGLPQEPPRPVQASISIDFCSIFDDFLYHVGYFLSGLSHYFFGYLELSFSNFWPQVQMCWGRPRGTVRSQKSAMWPTFCLACLFVFVTSSPTFQVSGHRFFGVVSGVIRELRSTARWREGRRPLRLLEKRTALNSNISGFLSPGVLIDFKSPGHQGCRSRVACLFNNVQSLLFSYQVLILCLQRAQNTPWSAHQIQLLVLPSDSPVVGSAKLK